MATILEFKCGCMDHSLAGKIRKCDGLSSRSCSGKMIPKSEGAEKRHNDAMAAAPVKSYDVAEIMP